MYKLSLPGRALFLFLIPALLAASIPVKAQFPEHGQMVAELIGQVDIEAITCSIEHLQDDQGTLGLDDNGTRFTPTLNATDNVKDIVDQFEAYGLETVVDTYSPTAEDCASITNGMDAVCPPANKFQNVIATLEGRDSSKYYLVMAHYDTINDDGEGWYDRKETIPAPGANDNASGVAIMIEVARVLSNSTFDYDIRFAALAAEEWGFLGSRRYVAQAIENNEHIAGFINLDMVWAQRPRSASYLRVLQNRFT
jgi:acetylornithine deacetylase/succinyl-diaminopimelate desuccinylase-like protein